MLCYCKFFLFNRNGVANGAYFSVGESDLGAGGFFAGDDLFGVSFRLDSFLRNEHNLADRAYFACGLSAIGTGCIRSCYELFCMQGLFYLEGFECFLACSALLALGSCLKAGRLFVDYPL